MPMASFDTISVAKRLEEEFAMPRQQAEGVAVVMHENLVGNLATKEDVKALRDDMKALDDKVDTSVKALDDKIDASVKALNDRIDGLATKDEMRAEIAELRTEIAQTANKTIYALGGLIGALFVIDRLLPLFGG